MTPPPQIIFQVGFLGESAKAERCVYGNVSTKYLQDISRNFKASIFAACPSPDVEKYRLRNSPQQPGCLPPSYALPRVYHVSGMPPGTLVDYYQLALYDYTRYVCV